MLPYKRFFKGCVIFAQVGNQGRVKQRCNSMLAMELWAKSTKTHSWMTGQARHAGNQLLVSSGWLFSIFLL